MFLPFISGTLVEPYVASVYGMLGQDIATDNLWLASICTVIVVAVLFAGLGTKQKSRRANVYLAGISRDNDSRAFQNSLSGTTEATTRTGTWNPCSARPASRRSAWRSTQPHHGRRVRRRHHRGPDGLLGRV